MDKYGLKDFNNVILFIWNRGYNEFKKMYEFLSLNGDSYIEEKFHKAQTNFGGWWLDLDEYYQHQIIKYVKDYYAA